MRLLRLLASSSLLASVCCTEAASRKLTNLVTWDKYSLSVNGTRVFIKWVLGLGRSAYGIV